MSRSAAPPAGVGLGEAEAGVLAALLRRSLDLVCVASVEDQVLFMNPAGRALVGLTPTGDLPGETMTDLIAPGHRDSYRARALPALLARGEWAGETVLARRQTGETVPVWLQVVMLPPAAQQPQAVLAFIGRDISERQGVARTLLATREALARATQAAQFGEMAATVAHEVSQPLAAMVASAQACGHWLAHDPPDLAEARAAVANIAEVGLRGGQLLDRMRALIRQSAVLSVELDVNDVIRQALQMAHTTAVHTEVALSLELQAGLPAVRCDAAQLQQVLLNLMKNSSQAMAALQPARRQLEIASQRGADGAVVVEVRDSGGGIAAAVLPHLFDAGHDRGQPGHRGDRADLPGLLVSRRIVEGHGGRLWVARSDAQGTVVAFSLPAAPPPEPGGAQAGSAPFVAHLEDKA